MRWRILPSARKAAKDRVKRILARNSGTLEPFALIAYADLLRLTGNPPETSPVTLQ